MYWPTGYSQKLSTGKQTITVHVYLGELSEERQLHEPFCYLF